MITTKLYKIVTFVVETAYFCVRPNKRREKKLSFLSNVSAIFVTKNKKQLFTLWEKFLSNFLGNFGQLFGKSRATCRKP